MLVGEVHLSAPLPKDSEGCGFGELVGNPSLEAFRSVREQLTHVTLADQAAELNHLSGWAWEQTVPGVVLTEVSPELSQVTQGDSNWSTATAHLVPFQPLMSLSPLCRREHQGTMG